MSALGRAGRWRSDQMRSVIPRFSGSPLSGLRERVVRSRALQAERGGAPSTLPAAALTEEELWSELAALQAWHLEHQLAQRRAHVEALAQDLRGLGWRGTTIDVASADLSALGGEVERLRALLRRLDSRAARKDVL